MKVHTELHLDYQIDPIVFCLTLFCNYIKTKNSPINWKAKHFWQRFVEEITFYLFFIDITPPKALQAMTGGGGYSLPDLTILQHVITLNPLKHGCSLHRGIG